MTSLFGVPMDIVLRVTVGLFGVATVALLALALRHRVLFKVGWRNIHRRRPQSVLIVFGLMLATVILSSAFTAGDTMSYTVRTFGANGLGAIDETIVPHPRSQTLDAFLTSQTFFPSTEARRVQRALSGNADVDGVTPAIVIPAPLRDLTSRQAKSSSDVVAVPARYPAAFGPLTRVDGRLVSLGQLHANEIYINEQAATGLNAHRGDTILLYLGGHGVHMRVAGVLRGENLASGGLIAEQAFTNPVAILPLARAQALAGHRGAITHVLISNRGDAISGATRTGAVHRALARANVLHGYVFGPVKQHALRDADRSGTVFTSGFIAFGLFSMAAGILLIFLLFVMLAAERRVEMGIERAIGTKRRHLVEHFIFEGYAYDLGAALAGVLLGIIVGLELVDVIGSLFSAQSGDVIHVQGHIGPRSIAVAFCLGAITTLLTVACSAWRVSRLNIVAALRDLPDETEIDTSLRAAFVRPIRDLARAWRLIRRRRLRGALLASVVAPWHALAALRPLAVRGPALVVAGVLLFELGSSSKAAFPYDLGLSLILIGTALLTRWVLRAAGMRESAANRIGFSLAGLSLVGFWLLPFDFFRSDLSIGPEMFFLYGMMLILGGVWTLMYNVDLLVSLALRLMSVAGGLAPALRMAVTYPLLHRLRTGLTLFMFSLVIFALMVEVAFNGSSTNGSLHLNRDAGGFAVYGTTTIQGGIPHLQRAIDSSPVLRRAGVMGGSAQRLAVEVRQPGTDGARRDLERANLVDNAFLKNTRFTLKSRALGFRSDAEVWRAMRSHRGYVVVPAGMATSDSSSSSGLRGVPYGGRFTPVHIVVKDPRTRGVAPLAVIGVLDFGADNVEATSGMIVAASTLAGPGRPAPHPETYVFHIPPGHDVHAMALAIGSTFLRYGLDVTETQVQFDADRSLTQGFYNLLAAFMGLGLIVGVAALGVIATRSVVERRQQIGVLRAIGFRMRTVQLTFALEASFVALGGIGLGVTLGLLFSYQLITYIAKSEPGLVFAVPWSLVAIIVGAAYLASIAMTYLPARQASRIHPAEALRYE